MNVNVYIPPTFTYRIATKQKWHVGHSFTEIPVGLRFQFPYSAAKPLTKKRSHQGCAIEQTHNRLFRDYLVVALSDTATTIRLSSWRSVSLSDPALQLNSRGQKKAAAFAAASCPGLGPART